MSNIPDNLFVFEMANNHMGSVAHGVKLIHSFAGLVKKFPEFNFAFKLQYRDLDTFIHPDLQSRTDIKYIKRFSETRLTESDFDELVGEMRKCGFYVMATSFDERSFTLIEKQNLDFVKIASCSFTDWPVLERAVKTGKPVIASTAGASIEEIDQVISFFQHRDIDFSILHCVGEYPTPDERMHLSQIDYLKKRYPGVRIGFSTHENPNNIDLVKMAIAKGADLFEKHVGLDSKEYPINAYSVTPEQAEKWLSAALYAKKVCGVANDRLPVNTLERESLQSLRRGMYAARDLFPGEKIGVEDFFFAFPPVNDQFTANDYSKYARFEVVKPIKANNPICISDAKIFSSRGKILGIVKKVKDILDEGKIVIPGGVEIEISHHYGLDKFEQYGLVMLTVVNRDYCKKILVTLPGQIHPEQFHLLKEETFHVLHGELDLYLDGQKQKLVKGSVVTVMPNVKHSFSSDVGAVIEEISTTHHKDDSYYVDESIVKNKDRKTFIKYWME